MDIHGTVTKIGLSRASLELFTDMTTALIPNAQLVTGAVKFYCGRQRSCTNGPLTSPTPPADGVRALVEVMGKHILAKGEVNLERC